MWRRGAALVEYFGKQDNRLFGSRLWCMRFLFRFQGLVCEILFVVVFFYAGAC